MKKLILVTACLFAFTTIYSQTLEEIVKKYATANKVDQMAGKKTVKITAKMSIMEMDMPMEMYMKIPNKIKTVTNFNGQEMIQAFDGVKGYTVNPMAGSSTPVEMSADEVKQLTRSNIFENYLDNYLKSGQLTLLGEEAVNGKPAFKIKAAIPGVNNMTLFIDKDSYLLSKTSLDVNQGGMAITLESYPSDYKDNNGIFLPMKTTTSASGMNYVITFTNVEVNVPIDDSVFQIK
jgi:outer membrane lipoprotein-sorting protein